MAIELKIKKTIPWFPVVMTIVFVIFFLATAYFLFFQTPPLIEEFLPTEGPDDAKIDQLKKLIIDPVAVTAHPLFQNLQDATVVLEPESVGRPNPYLPFSTSTLEATTTTTTTKQQ